MSISRVVVRFASGYVLKQVGEIAADEGMYSAALAIEAQAKINIVTNDQVDTGFMLNSGYAIGKHANSEGEAWKSGNYPSRRSGELEKRRREGGQSLKSGARAAVVWSAIYSFWQEMKQPFILPAAKNVGRQFKLKVETAFRRKL